MKEITKKDFYETIRECKIAPGKAQVLLLDDKSHLINFYYLIKGTFKLTTSYRKMKNHLIADFVLF